MTIGRTLSGAFIVLSQHEWEFMKITVQVKPNSRSEGVELREDGVYLVKVAVPPIEGKANERLVEVLAKHFKKPKRAVGIVAGGRSRHKIVEIL